VNHRAKPKRQQKSRLLLQGEVKHDQQERNVWARPKQNFYMPGVFAVVLKIQVCANNKNVSEYQIAESHI